MPYQTYVPPYDVSFPINAGVGGLLILAATYFVHLRPARHIVWGVMTIVLSVASAFAAVT